MKKTKVEKLDLYLYQKTLSNGLDIVFIPFENKKSYFMSYATRYGSTTTSFIPLGSKKMVDFPSGIAHFLEHKMFEQESGEDPFTFFSKSGTGANASTSFDSTQYICYGNKNFKNNLRYLISFVNNPYFTAENVEKEKGIIIEELKMYMDIPDYQLSGKLRENVYVKNQRRIDIGGTISDVERITKEDLYNCYNSFYSPNNMFIIIVGNFSMDDALEVIEEELKDKKKVKLPKIKKIKEPVEVGKKIDTIKANINIPKLAYALKVPTNNLKISNQEQLDLYFSILTTSMFGISSLFRERVRTKKLINNFYTEWETIDDYKVFNIYSSTNDMDELIKEIKYEFDNISIDKETFERIKKVWIANEIKLADNVDSTISNFYDDMIRYKKIIPNRVEIIKKLKLSTLRELIKDIDFNNCSIVKMIPND